MGGPQPLDAPKGLGLGVQNLSPKRPKNPKTLNHMGFPRISRCLLVLGPLLQGDLTFWPLDLCEPPYL